MATYTRIIENLVLTKTMRLEGSQWDNTLIRNVTIKDVSGDGFFLKNVKNVRIENCTVDNVSGVGIKLSSEGSTQNVILDGNKVSRIGRDGLSAAQRDGVDHPGLQVLNNTFDKTGLSGSGGLLHGIYVQSTDFVIKGNHVTNSMDGNGISVRSSGLVANNVVEYTGKSGIAYYADHMRGPSDLLTIENNLVMDSGNRETVRNDIDLLNVPNTSNVVHNFTIRNNNIIDTSNGVGVHSDYSKLGISPKVSGNNVVSLSTAKSLVSSTLSGGSTTTPDDGATTPPADTTAPESGSTTATSGADKITGGTAADIIDGKGGNDTLTGGSGGDTFVIAKGMGSDTITDFYPQWADVIRLVDYGLTSFDQVKPLLTQTGADTVIKFANGETLTLKNVSATALAASEFAFVNNTAPAPEPAPEPAPAPTPGKTVTGTASADTLTGGAGNDTLTGGAGGDTFVIAKGMGSDTITDFYPQWADVIRLVDYGLTSFDQVKPLLTQSGADTVIKFANGETLTLKNVSATALAASEFAFDNATQPTDLPVSGSTTKTITGTSSNNTLRGTDANEFIDGRGGDDTMYGGKGDDTYVIDRAGDKVVEYSAQGVDTVRASVSHTLAANVENVVLTGSSAINATGNGAANRMAGNSAVNTLSGGAGDDMLIGGGGADKLTGGTGADSFVFRDVADKGDTVTDFAVGVDHLDFRGVMDAVGYTGSDAIADGRLNITQSGANTQVSVVDANGASHQMVTLLGVTAGSLTLDDDVWA